MTPAPLTAGSGHERLGARGRYLQLRADVACQRVGVAGPRRAWLHGSQLSHARSGLLVVVVERLVGHAGVAWLAGQGVERVEGVADQGEAVALAPQADQAGRVPGEVDHLEAGDRVALRELAVDSHRPAVPRVEDVRVERAQWAVAVPPRQLRVVEVRVAGLALGVHDLLLVAPDGRPGAARRAAVVGMRVAEHDAPDAAHDPADVGHVARHLPDPGVEDGHPAAGLLDEVDVHDRVREAAAHDPHAVGRALHRDRRRAAPDLLPFWHDRRYTGRHTQAGERTPHRARPRGAAGGRLRRDEVRSRSLRRSVAARSRRAALALAQGAGGARDAGEPRPAALDRRLARHAPRARRP